MATNYNDMDLWEAMGMEMPDAIKDLIAGYEGVDMTSRWEGTKAERDALRRRGINPKYFNPRLAGAFKGYEFSGDFGQDLRALNELYTGAGGRMMEGVAKSPQSLPGFDYQRALDALFQQYPEQQTQAGRHYLNVGIPYFRQGDQTGWQPGGQLGDFSTFHINDDTDAFGKFIGGIADSPIPKLLDIAIGGPAAAIPGAGDLLNFGPGGDGFDDSPGYGGPMPSDIIGGISDLIGDGGTFDGPPRIPGGGFETIWDNPEGVIPTLPGEDIRGPGGEWDLPVLDRPGGVPGEVQPTLPPQPEDLPTYPAEPGGGGAPGEPGGGMEEPTQPPQDIPDDPTEPGTGLPGLPGIPGSGGDEDIPGDYPGPGPTVPGVPGGYDPSVENPQGGDDVSWYDPWLDIGRDFLEWGLPNIREGEWDWFPGTGWPGTPPWGGYPGGGSGTGIGTGGAGGAGGAGGTGGSVGDINIDFGDIADLLGTIIGGWQGYEESRQDPQYPTMKDLYGRQFEGPMKGARWDILNMLPEDMVAGLTPEQLEALEAAAGYGREGGTGYDVLQQQLQQGGAGLTGLDRSRSYADALLMGGGPQFQYNQGVFDQTMQNLMPGVQGSYLDATRDLFRNLNEQQLPGIQMGAAGTGNLASSRAGIAEGIATRGALDRAGDIQSQLMQNALNQAQGAAMGAGGQNLRADLGTMGNLFNAYGAQAQYGLPGLGEAYRTGLGNIGALQGSGDFMRAYNQQLLDAPRNLLGWQIPLINMTTPMGVTSSQGTPYTSPGALQGIMTGMQTGAGIWDFLRQNNPFSTAQNAAGTT